MNSHQPSTTLDNLLRLLPPLLTDGDPHYGKCPPPESIWEVHCGHLSRDRVGEILDHATFCPTCSHEFVQARLLACELGEARRVQDLGLDVSLHSNEEGDTQAVSGLADIDDRLPESDRFCAAPSVRRRPLWFSLLPLAATLLFVVGAVNFWLPLDSRGLTIAQSTSSLFDRGEMRRTDDLRGPETEQRNVAPDARDLASVTARNSVTVTSLIADGATMSRDRFLLRWEGPEDARYAVRVLTLESVLYTDSDLKTAELLVPERMLTAVTSGTTILWQVDANVPGGVPVSSSTFRVELK